MNWYVIYTKPRNEKKVAETLNKMGIIVYCPMKKEVKQWSDRKKNVETPLLTSYVFVQLEDKDRDVVFLVNGVVRYLFWLGKPVIVRQNEIETLKEFTQNNYTTITSSTLKPGDKMKIEKGVFIGQEAIIQEINPNKIILILESIGVLLTIEK